MPRTRWCSGRRSSAYTAHREWAIRPPDGRYASGHSLYEPARARVDQWAKKIVAAPAEYRPAMEAIVKSLDASFSGHVDLREDLLAWREIIRDLAIHLGKNHPLERFLQELQTAFEGTDTEPTEPDADDHPRL